MKHEESSFIIFFFFTCNRLSIRARSSLSTSLYGLRHTWGSSHRWYRAAESQNRQREGPWTSLICVSSPKCVYMCVRRCPPQTPNAFICVSPNAFICVSPNAFICVSPNAFICVSPNASAESATQRSSLRSLTFARFARTFFNSLNWNSCLKSILV